jgi:hypothetical protein
VAAGNSDRDLKVPPKAMTWPSRTAIAADSRGAGAGKESRERQASWSREGLVAVEGEEGEASEGERLAATGVETRDANGFEEAAGASSSFGRLASSASVICGAGFSRSCALLQLLRFKCHQRPLAARLAEGLRAMKSTSSDALHSPTAASAAAASSDADKRIMCTIDLNRAPKT